MSSDGEWLREDREGGGWFGFLLKLAGLVIAVGIGAMIVAFIWSRASVAFGFLGGFLVIALLLVLAGWLYDRRHAYRGPE